MQSLLDVLSFLIRPEVLFPAALGTLMGVYVGAIPGLSGTMAVSLLVSLTYAWAEIPAIALIMGVFVGVVYGGSRSAILLNIPGAPAAVATGFDGYPLAQKGKAAQAMGLACVQSFFGTVLGILALAFLTPQIAKISSLFKSFDFLLLGLLALLLVGSVSRKSLLRGLLGAAMGLFLGCVGNTSQFSVNRFTLGIRYLDGGIGFIVAMIGLFGAGEALYQLSIDRPITRQEVPKRIVPPFKTVLKHLPLTLFSSVLGIFVGALPGAGGDMAALLSYDAAKRAVRKNEVPFGEGAVEGLIAPETANNAAIGGALIPMLTLGVPGDSVTAILLAVFTIHGLQPGPTFLMTGADSFHAILAGGLLGSVYLLLLGLLLAPRISRVIRVPRRILLSIVAVLCVIGAYACRTRLFDVGLMLFFGVLGFLLRRRGYSVAPLTLGLVLGGMMDSNFRRAVSLASTADSPAAALFGRPITLILLVLTLAAILARLPAVKKRLSRRKEQ